MAEIARAAASGLRGGILIPSMWGPYAPYHDPALRPDLGRLLGARDAGARPLGGGRPGAATASTSASTWPRCGGGRPGPCGSCSGRGVFERFPGPDASCTTECGAFWAADLLWTNDIVYDREHAARKLGTQLTAHLSMRPSEYFDRNCFIGASNTRRRELARRYEIGVGNIMWGNDFPHPEGTWPHTREFLANAFHDIPVDETPGMLGTNAAECYGFDPAALRPLADRHRAHPEELGQTGDDLAKWSDLAAAGRPWLTGKEALDLPTGD